MEQRGRGNDGENKQVKENGENRQRKRWKELIDSQSKGWRKQADERIERIDMERKELREQILRGKD